MAGRLHRAWSWLWETRDPEPKPNSTCPICDHPVAIGATMFDGGSMGPMFSPPTPQERIAACPEHGRQRRPPGNVPPGPPASGGDG